MREGRPSRYAGAANRPGSHPGWIRTSAPQAMKKIPAKGTARSPEGAVFSMDHQSGQRRHPPQAGDPCGEHDQHQRPAAADAAEHGVGTTESERPRRAALVVAQQKRARMPANRQAAILQRGELERSRKQEDSAGDHPSCAVGATGSRRRLRGPPRRPRTQATRRPSRPPRSPPGTQPSPGEGGAGERR